MPGRVQRTNTHIDRVKCAVNTCQYYENGDYCNAESIEIQPRNAKTTEDTDCATFAPKANM